MNSTTKVIVEFHESEQLNRYFLTLSIHSPRNATTSRRQILPLITKQLI